MNRANLVGRVLILVGIVLGGFGVYLPYWVPYPCGSEPPIPNVCYFHQSIQFGFLFFVGIALLGAGIIVAVRARQSDGS